MEEIGDNHIKQIKSTPKRQTVCVFSYLWVLGVTYTYYEVKGKLCGKRRRLIRERLEGFGENMLKVHYILR